MGQPVAIAPAVVVVVSALIAACTDIRKFKVYNLLTYPLLLSGLAHHGLANGWSGFAASFLGALFGFAVLFVFYLMGGMGAGDVKLMAGIGAWLGLPLTYYVFLVSAIAAGLYSIVLILAQRDYRNTWVNLKILGYRYLAVTRHLAAEDQVEEALNSPTRRRQCIPFAAMVALGILCTLGWLVVAKVME
jgi:prepilin peptidase CpaA